MRVDEKERAWSEENEKATATLKKKTPKKQGKDKESPERSKRKPSKTTQQNSTYPDKPTQPTVATLVSG